MRARCGIWFTDWDVRHTRTCRRGRRTFRVRRMARAFHLAPMPFAVQRAADAAHADGESICFCGIRIC